MMTNTPITLEQMANENAKKAIDILKHYNQDDSERLIGITEALDAKGQEIVDLWKRVEAARSDREAYRKAFIEKHEQVQSILPIVKAAVKRHQFKGYDLLDIEMPLSKACEAFLTTPYSKELVGE